jgi:hypothetical protein
MNEALQKVEFYEERGMSGCGGALWAKLLKEIGDSVMWSED